VHPQRSRSHAAFNALRDWVLEEAVVYARRPTPQTSACRSRRLVSRRYSHSAARNRGVHRRRRLDLLAHRARIVTDRDGAAWSEADCSLEDAACGRRDGTLQEYRNN